MLREIRAHRKKAERDKEARGLKKRWILIPAGVLLLLGLAVPWLPQKDASPLPAAVPVTERNMRDTEERGETVLLPPSPEAAPSEPPTRGLPEASADTEESEQTAEYAYVGSVNSDKYHLPTCSRVSAIREENRVGWASPEEAEAEGREACKICKPGEAE